MARLYRTTGMLLRGGMPAVAALQMSAGLLRAGSRPAFAAATQCVREGQSLAQAMERNGLTNPVAARMLKVGERSGNMGEMMERIASFCDEELARWVAIVTRLIEPVLMTVIGLVIGVIVVLMYFPIFQLAGSIR
jgi:general secretion pathway protein F